MICINKTSSRIAVYWFIFFLIIFVILIIIDLFIYFYVFRVLVHCAVYLISLLGFRWDNHYFFKTITILIVSLSLREKESGGGVD